MPLGAPLLPGLPPRDAFRMEEVRQRMRETPVFMRVGVPVVRYHATLHGTKSRQKLVISTLFCGFCWFFYLFCLFLPGFARLAGLARLKISAKTKAQDTSFQAE
jgi:hypothetical protein